MSTRDERGFTLLELVIALAIVGALLVIAFGGMRVALASWRQGDDRAEVHQHLRSVATTVGRALGAAYPYRAARSQAPEPAVLFNGSADSVEFVTQTPPFPPTAPIAFTAVVLSLETGGDPGLVVRQRSLPNQEPFKEATVVLRDPGVTRLAFEYLGDTGWTDTWDGQDARTMPRAVKVTIGVTLHGQTQTLPMTIALRLAPPR